MDATTQRALPVAMIEASMTAIHFRVAPKKNAKQQALKLIPLLAETLPIERAKMLVRVVGDAGARDATMPRGFVCAGWAL